MSTGVGGAWAPLAVPVFRLHFAARLLSWSGTAIAPIALAFAVLGLPGGGGAGLGWVLACGMAPQLVLLLIGGASADRWPRLRVMAVANTVSSVAQATAAILLWTRTAQVWQLAALSAACGAAAAFFTPACSAVLTDLVPEHVRPAANALLRLGQNVVKVGGPAAGAALVALVGSAWVIAWDALSFACAAALFASLPHPADTTTSSGRFHHDLREGWQDFRSRRWLVAITTQGALIVPVWMAGYQLLGPVYGHQVLGGPAAWGVVTSGFAGGLVTGSGAALWWRPVRSGVTVCAATVPIAAPLAVIAVDGGTAGLTVAAAVAGAASAVSMTVWTGVLQERVPGARLSRAVSYATLGQSVTVPLGYLAAAPAAQLFGLECALGAGAAIIAVLSVLPLTIPEVRGLRGAVTSRC